MLAIDKLFKNEGKYSNLSGDTGGETYRGISRNYNKSWEGWKIIDEKKNKDDFPYNLDSDIKLNNLIQKFYKENYWLKFSGNLIPSQLIANELLDTSVNIGIKTSNEFFQKSLNILNRNQKLYKDLIVDGLIGRKTIKSLIIILSNKEEELLYKILNIYQGQYYLNITDYNKIYEKFIRGWLSRVKIIN